MASFENEGKRIKMKQIFWWRNEGKCRRKGRRTKRERERERERERKELEMKESKKTISEYDGGWSRKEKERKKKR